MNSILAHLRDIIILPFTVTVIVPWYFIRPQFEDGTTLYKVCGLALGLIGLSLFLYTVFLFRTIGKGTLAPWSPKKKLVIVGPYCYCRNPMITGVLTILLGESLFFQSMPLLSWTGLFFLINMFWFMVFEEPDLEHRFGDDYRLYKKNVPRWIPRLTPWQNY